MTESVPAGNDVADRGERILRLLKYLDERLTELLRKR